jgi:glycerol kinase
VLVPEVAQTTALGAAYLAGIGTGIWTLEQLEVKWREAKRYRPGMQAAEREALIAEWRRALERARSN